jgi:hypothetical protein
VSADHRKPLVAFVALAFAAAAIVGIQRAEAHAGRFLAAVVGTSVRVQGTLTTDVAPVEAAIRAAGLGPAFSSLDRVLRGGVSEPLETLSVETAVAAHRVAERGLPADTVSRGRAASATAAVGNGRGRGHGRGPEAATEHGKKAGSGKSAQGQAGQTGKRVATPAQPRMTARHTASERIPAQDGADRAAHEPAGLGNGPVWVERASRGADRRRPAPRGWMRAVHHASGGSAR